VIVRGVHAGSRGRTLRQLMNAQARFYVEQEDNANLQVTVNAGTGCDAIEGDFKQLVCGTPVMVFSDYHDNNACVQLDAYQKTFAIGGETSFSERWYNCAGWPQHWSNQGQKTYPSNFRAYVR
jgi:hypothetical protein